MNKSVQTVAGCIVKPGKWENDIYIYIGAISVKSTSRKAGQVTWACARRGGGWEVGQSPQQSPRGVPDPSPTL